MTEEFIFMGAVQDNQPYVTQKGRVDKRLIRITRENFMMDSGQEIVLLDAKERGDLYEIRIVSDNPYLEVFLEMDEWRNDNASAAEILAQPDTGRLLSNFQAIDGGHPGIGYTLIYNPDIPEDYDGRLRVVLRNRIKASKKVLGQVTAPYRSKGDLATPLENSFGGGFMVHAQSLSGLQITGNGEDIGMAMAMNTGIDFLNNPGVSNPIFHGATGLGIKKGVLHPYVGLAGRPIMTGDTTANEAGTFVHVFWDEPVDQANTKRRVWTGDGSQDIYIVDFGGNVLTTGFAVGDRIWVRDGPATYFPGEITAIATNQAMPAKFAVSAAATAYTGSIKITVSPGMKFIPPPTRISNGGGNLVDSTGTGVGTLTTQADINPQILVKRVEIKRLKRVSYDG